jgi:hypothetical protein
MEPDKLSRGLACWPFRPAIFEIRDGDHPIVFQHGDNQIARQAAGPSYLRIAKRAATL